MSKSKETLKEAMKTLKQQRDEIKLKIHLGEMELRDEWDALERKYLELKDRYEPAVEAAEETAEETWEGMKLIAEELKNGFKKIWKSL